MLDGILLLPHIVHLVPCAGMGSFVELLPRLLHSFLCLCALPYKQVCDCGWSRMLLLWRRGFARRSQTMEVVYATGVARTADAVRSLLSQVRALPWTWHCEYNCDKGCLVFSYILPPTCVDSLVVGFLTVMCLCIIQYSMLMILVVTMGPWICPRDPSLFRYHGARTLPTRGGGM